MCIGAPSAASLPRSSELACLHLGMEPRSDAVGSTAATWPSAGPRRPTSSSGWSRTRSLAGAGRGAAGAAADAEEPDRRAATRRARGAGAVPADHRGGARRAVGSTLLRARFAAKCEIAVKPYRGYLQLGEGEGIPNDDYGVEAFESWTEEKREAAEAEGLDRAADRGGHARLGPRARRDVLPAEAGLDETHVSFTKGCYPGPGAHRAAALPRPPESPAGGDRSRCRAPGRRDLPGREDCRPRHERCPGKALGYVRREVPEDAALQIDGAEARLHFATRARSSGDRALPCGGRGRKFESCRAHRWINGRCHDSSGEGGICVEP